jgi:uncharacterized protein YgiM (DUF1202 family)
VTVFGRSTHFPKKVFEDLSKIATRCYGRSMATFPSQRRALTVGLSVFALAFAAIATTPDVATAAELSTEFCVANSPDGTLNFRATPSASARIITTLKNGDCGLFIADKPSRSNNFVKVSYRGTSGWVKSKWIVRVDQLTEDGEGDCGSIPNSILVDCNGDVSFDGGQTFQGGASKTNFDRFMRGANPVDYRFEKYRSSGVLRWPTGDCVYKGTASGSHKVWCGSRTEMSKVASALFPEPGGDPDLEVMCVLKGQVEVVNVTQLGLVYDRELCKKLGGKLATP